MHASARGDGDGAAYRRHSRNSCALLHRADLIRGDKQRATGARRARRDDYRDVLAISPPDPTGRGETRSGGHAGNPEWPRVVGPLSFRPGSYPITRGINRTAVPLKRRQLVHSHILTFSR